MINTWHLTPAANISNLVYNCTYSTNFECCTSTYKEAFSIYYRLLLPPLHIICKTISVLSLKTCQLVQDSNETEVSPQLLPCEVNQTSISADSVCDRASPRQRLPLGEFWPRLHLSSPVALKVPAASGAGGAKAPLNTERISNAARFRGAVTSIKSILTLY